MTISETEIEAHFATDVGEMVERLNGGTKSAAAVRYPFRLTEEAVEFAEEKDESTEWQFVCSKLEIVAATRSEAGEEWGRLLNFRDRDGREHQWSMPMEMLAGDGVAYRERLLSMGLIVAPGRHARDRLYQYIASTTPSARARAVSRIGWYHGDSFIFPDVVIGVSGTERLLYQSTTAIDHAFHARGTLEDWQRKVAEPSAGNSRLVFALCAAFAAPLLSPMGEESGGFNLVGPSSIGKTTALEVAGSVWGGGPHGYIRQWRATANGLEAVAALHCDALLVLDEIAQISSREAGEVAYLLANGQGKSRARRDGSGRPPMTWRTLFLSSGEISLADKVSEDGRRRATAGQRVRVVDIPANAGARHGLLEDLHGSTDGHTFVRRLKDATKRLYGTAILAFLAQLATNVETACAAVSTARADFVNEECPRAADGQVQRVATRFGLVCAAGELAIALGVLPWPRGEARRAAALCFKAWLESRGGSGPAEIEAGIAQVRKFFEQHGESRFTSWDRKDAERGNGTINRAGWRRHYPESDMIEFYVLPEVFRTELCNGFDARALAQEMVRRGLLIAEPNGKTVASCTLPGLGKKRVYHFSNKILEDGDDDE